MASSPEISSFGLSPYRTSAGQPGTVIIDAGTYVTINNDKASATA